MRAIYYLIKRSTLVEIADAIRVVKELDSSIPVSKLDDALRGILSRSTARSTEHEEYLIKLQTLVDIADVVRELLGTSEKFVVRELAKKILDILNKKKQLAAPYIWLETVEDAVGDRTPAILGIAILGKTILGDYSTGLPQLAAPVIYLEEESELPKLAAPEIYLEEVSDLIQLEAPVIHLEEVAEGHEHSYTSVTTAPTCTERGYTTHTCACGSTYKDSYTDALGHSYGDPYFSSEFTTGYGRKCERCGALESMTSPLVQLAAPVIYLEEENETPDEPEGPIQLAAPVIYLEEAPHLLAPTASVINEDGVDYLIWTPVEGAEHYRVYHKCLNTSVYGYLWVFPNESVLKVALDESLVNTNPGMINELYVQAHDGTVADESASEYEKYYSESGYSEPSNTITYTVKEILPAQLDMPLIYLEPVVFEGEVTTAYYEDVNIGGALYKGTYVVFDEEMLDSSVESYTVEIDGVEYICKLTLDDYMWTDGENLLDENNTIILSKTSDDRTLFSSTLFSEAGEVHYVKITETVEKPESYKGSVWAFYRSLPYDAMAEYISTNGTNGVLGFDVKFSTMEEDYPEYGRMEFHDNSDEGDGIYFYYLDDPDGAYNPVGAWGSDDCWAEGANIVTLNEEPSAELLQFLRTFAERQRLILAGDYALTTSPAEDVYAIIDDAELEDYLPFSIYIKYTNVSEAGDNSGLEFDHIDITEDGVVYVYEDNADYYVECYADPDDGDQTFFTVLEDTYVSEIEYKVFEALKY